MMLGSQVPWSRTSQIEILITRACEPSLLEPNYASHLEIAQYINEKKANVPREAAMLIANLANNRNPHIALLALALLDTLIQSCGYPFHLQISTKEFLNELVRRFPERPPMYPGPVMSRILELIQGWKEGICQESRWKDDLTNIKDMYRLLTLKGYRFRHVPRQSSMPPAANLKSADELESEDREAQSAKLQELIRRGTPRDLAAAQELMKVLAGADPDSKPDYRTQALTELNKLESKVILLNEMLDNVDASRGERTVSGDAYDQVASILKSARPKIQKWISDAESDDPESLDTFLSINDQINTVISRFEAFQRGDYEAAANAIPAELGGSSHRTDQSLINFDEENSAATSNQGTSAANEIMELFGPSSSTSPPPAQAAPHISPGYSGNAGFMRTPPPVNIATRPGFSSQTPPQSNTPMGSIMLPSTPKSPSSGQNVPRTYSPNYFSNGTPTPAPANPAPTSQASSSGQQAKDPFADLAGLF